METRCLISAQTSLSFAVADRPRLRDFDQVVTGFVLLHAPNHAPIAVADGDLAQADESAKQRIADVGVACELDHLLQGLAQDLWVSLEKVLQILDRIVGQTDHAPWDISVLLLLSHALLPDRGRSLVAVHSRPAAVRVELGLEFGSVEPEGRDRVVQVGVVAGIGELTRQDEGVGGQVGPDAAELIEVLHGDGRSNRAAVTLDDDVLTAFSVLDQARDTAAGGCGDGQGPLGVYVSEDGHARNCTEHSPENQGRARRAPNRFSANLLTR